MLEEDKTLGANGINDFKDYYTKLFKNETPKKHSDHNHGPVICSAHLEQSPSPSVIMVKRNNKEEMFHTNNIKEHSKTHMQTPT